MYGNLIKLYLLLNLKEGGTPANIRLHNQRINPGSDNLKYSGKITHSLQRLGQKPATLPRLWLGGLPRKLVVQFSIWNIIHVLILEKVICTVGTDF